MKTDPNDIISSLYEAVGNDDAWHGLVQTLCRLLNANIGMLVVAGQGQRDQSFYAAFNHRESVARAYSDHWWRHDIWLHTGLAKGLFRKGNIMIGTDYVDTNTLKQTAFYTDFLSTMPAEHLLAAILSDGSDPLAAPPMSLSFFRPPGVAGFSQDDKSMLQLLYPHIHRAFELHWAWRNMREQLNIFHSSLDNMDFGVMFIDATRRVRHANLAAKALSASILQPHLPTTGAVAEMIDSAALGKGGSTVVEKPQIMLLALPVSAPVRNPAGETRASVMLLLVDPQNRPEAAASFLSSAFALSKAESRILPLLLQGRSPADIATTLNLKLPTVRSQLSAIFAKTGTSRQQELIRLLGAVPPCTQQTTAAFSA